MSWLQCCLFLTALPCIIFAQFNDPPVINGSYKAMGEMVANLTDGDGTIQMAFEEHYDNKTGNAEFTVWELGNNVTYIEYGKTNQTLLYTNSRTCEVVTKKNWIDVRAPPSLLGYNDSSGKIRFSLRQLLDLDKKYLVQKKKANLTMYRKVPAVSWLYEIRGTEEKIRTLISVYAYWSRPVWNSTSGKERVPLGFEITKLTMAPKVTSAVQYVNVFAFLKDVVDKKAFAPREGIYCKGRTHPYELPKLPLVSSLSLRSEFILPDYQTIDTMDAYYDVKNGFLRVDLDRLDDQDATARLKTGRRYTSQVTSKQLGASFRMDAFQGKMTCTVQPIDKYQFDPQEIINPKLDLKKWSIHSIIGRNTTNYVYIGKTYKRNIPCQLYQGLRTDWPEEGGQVTSLWEWCFAFMIESEDEIVNYLDEDIPLISASINITESKNTDFPVGFRMIHHFYDVRNENPTNMSLATFDISRCFKPEEKLYLQFVVDRSITDDNIHIFENATSDVGYLNLWKSAIGDACKTSLKSLRIIQVISFVYQKTLYVEFMLLGLHKDLPADAKKGELSLQDSYASLQKTIDSGKLNVSYQPSSKSQKMVLNAKKKSLREVFDKNTKPTPITGLPTQSTEFTYGTLPPFTLVIDTTSSTGSGGIVTKTGTPVSTDGQSVTTTTSNETSPSTVSTVDTATDLVTPEPEITRYEGHKPGTAAGVSVAMLLIGVTMGACGTFYHFKGLPSFFRSS